MRKGKITKFFVMATNAFKVTSDSSCNPFGVQLRETLSGGVARCAGFTTGYSSNQAFGLPGTVAPSFAEEISFRIGHALPISKRWKEL